MKKTNSWNRLLSLALCICMVLSLVPASALSVFAAEDIDRDTLYENTTDAVEGEVCAHTFDSTTGKCGMCQADLAVASLTAGETVTYYTTADGVFAAAKNSTGSATITILADARTTGYVILHDREDLALVVEEGAVLTLGYILYFSNPISGGGTIAGEGNGDILLYDGGTIDGVTVSTSILNLGGAIIGGTFSRNVDMERGQITGGTFNGPVTNEGGQITGGIFHGAVINEIRNADLEQPSISGGIFNNSVSNQGGLITGGTFNAQLTNSAGWAYAPGVGDVEFCGKIINTADPTTFTLGEAFVIENMDGTIDCASHIWKDGFCRLCGKPCAHTGGEATCTEKAVCDICGISYGQVNPDAHSGGTATCTTQAVCETCGASYGELDPYNHTDVTAVFEWPDSYSDYMEVYVRLNCVCGEEVDYFWVYGDAITVETLPGTDCKNPTVATCTLNYEYNGVTYTDTKTYIVPGDPHAGEFVNGFCSACGGFEEAVWNEEDGVYEISNAGQLYWYAQYLNTTNAEIYAELTADIVIPENAPNWEPINASYAYFNGNFHTISGLKCIGGDAQYVGLFGMEGWWYEISNLHIDSSHFEGSGYVGGVVACMTNGGSITNCAVTNTTVQGDGDSVGTLAGYLSVGSVINCFVDTNTLVGGYTNGYVTIENSYYLSETETEDGGKTAEQFASGEVAYLLQSAIAGEDLWDEETGEWIGTAEPELIWGQAVGQDAYPVLKGQKVYENLDCAGAVAGYANEIIIPEHSFVQGYCRVCGEPLGDAVLDGVTYVFGGVIPLRWYLSRVEVPTYWVAGDGYVYFDPAAKLLTLDNATVYSELWSSEDSAVYWEDDLVINFSGTNTMSANDHNNGIVILVKGAAVMNGIGKDAVLNINSGADEAARFGSLTVNSGSVSFVSKDSAHTSAGVSTVALTVAEGAVVNVTAGNANSEYGLSYGMATEKLHVDGTLNASYGFCVNERECLSCGVLCTELTGSGTINALMLQLDQENMILNFTACGKAVLASNWKATTDEGSTVTNIFTVAEGAILTIPEGVTLDLTEADFTFAGTVINQGIILLPADFALDDAPKSGTIRIGEKGYIYDSVDGKWYCTEDGHIGGTATCTARAVCETCGASYGELDPANHDKTVSFDDNGFCPGGCYEPAILNADGYYEISNAGQLYWFMEKVNSGDNTINGVLTADIVVNRSVLQSDGTLNGDGTNFRAWFPIGYWHDCDADGEIEDLFFSGVFDGRGHTVSGLYFNNEDQTCVGLFGSIHRNATVKNVGVIDSYLNGNDDVGAVAGYNEGAVTDCYSKASVSSGDSMIGGVVGENQGAVENCYHTGAVIGNHQVGGVVGSNDGTVTNCYHNGTVSGENYVGGAVGENSGAVTNCYNTGAVSGGEKVGGVVGYNEGTVTNCHNTGAVSCSGRGIGGVEGGNTGAVTNCYYLDTCGASGNGTAKTADQFASGEVAYLLGEAFGQTISADDYPILSGAKVYQVSNCLSETVYSNTDCDIDHNWLDVTCTDPKTCSVCGETNGDALGHHYEQGICINCGDRMVVTLVLNIPCIDGSEAYTETLSAEYGTPVYLSQPPVYEGYVCEGYADGDGNLVARMPDYAYTLTESTTLYARYVRGSKVTLCTFTPTGVSEDVTYDIALEGQDYVLVMDVPEGAYVNYVSMNIEDSPQVVKLEFKNNVVTVPAEQITGNFTIYQRFVVDWIIYTNGATLRDEYVGIDENVTDEYFKTWREYGYSWSFDSWTMLGLVYQKPGYVLAKVNTEPDGSGIDLSDYHVPGTSNVEFYMIWEPCDHSFAENHICEICGINECSALGHSYEDDVCTICGHIGVPVKLDSASLSFKEKIHYNIFFYLGVDETVELADMGLILFDSLNADGTVDDAIATYSGAVQMDGKYMVATEGIHAKRMGDTIYFRVYAKLADGSYVYSKTVEYSAVTYAQHILKGNYSDSDKALVVAMLNYGAQAQRYFGYNTENPVNAGLTEEQQALVKGYESDLLAPVQKPDSSKTGAFASTGSGFAKKAPAVSFEGSFLLNYFFTPSETVAGDMTLYYWTEADYAAATELTAENATGSIVMTPGAQYHGVLDGIYAKDADATVYVAAVYSDGTATHCTGVLPYSIGAYLTSHAAKETDFQAMAQAAAVYCSYCKEYFKG